MFAVPRADGLVMIGITDGPFDGPIPDVPAVDADEEAFLLSSIGRVLERTLTSQDVVGRFAGLRPLLASDAADADEAADTADLSRRHAVVEHDGIVTVVGGKLTTARRMAQDALDRLAARPGAGRAGPCVTHRIRLAGADRPADAHADPLAARRPGLARTAALRGRARAGADGRGPARPPHARRARAAAARRRARRRTRRARGRRARLTHGAVADAVCDGRPPAVASARSRTTLPAHRLAPREP